MIGCVRPLPGCAAWTGSSLRVVGRVFGTSNCNSFRTADCPSSLESGDRLSHADRNPTTHMARLTIAMDLICCRVLGSTGLRYGLASPARTGYSTVTLFARLRG